MIDPWRQRCPKGHASLTRYAETYYCEACDRTFAGEPYDAKDTEFPVDDEPLPQDTREGVLSELVRKCAEPTTNWLQAHAFDIGRPRQVGQILVDLEEDGLVERRGSGSPNGYLWRPTEAGRQQVIETGRDIVLEQGRKQRAQLTPPAAIGFATVFFGLLLLVGYAIASGVIVG